MSKSIFSIIILFFSVTFLFIYVKPLYERVQSHRAGIVDLDKILASAGAIESLIGETEKNLSVVAPLDKARFAVFLPEVVDEVRLAYTLQHIGVRRNVVLEDISVERQVDKETSAGASVRTGVAGAIRNTLALDRTSQTLSGEGGATSVRNRDTRYKTTKAIFSFDTTYPLFQSFLGDLEKSLELMDIVSISFMPAPSVATGGRQTNEPPLYRFTVELETYSLQ